MPWFFLESGLDLTLDLNWSRLTESLPIRRKLKARVRSLLS